MTIAQQVRTVLGMKGENWTKGRFVRTVPKFLFWGEKNSYCVMGAFNYVTHSDKDGRPIISTEEHLRQMELINQAFKEYAADKPNITSKNVMGFNDDQSTKFDDIIGLIRKWDELDRAKAL